MKPLIVSFISFILLICIWFMFISHTERSLSELIYSMNTQVYEKIENDLWEEGYHNFNELSIGWDKHKYIYNIFSDHQAITTIDLSLARISEYIHHGEKNMALAEIAVVQECFKHLHTGELFSVDNIL